MIFACSLFDAGMMDIMFPFHHFSIDAFGGNHDKNARRLCNSQRREEAELNSQLI